MNRKLLNRLGPLVAGALFVAALLILHNQLKNYDPGDVLRSVRAMADGRVGIAVLLTFLSYFTLAHYDALAFRYIHRPVPYAASILGGFVGYAFSSNGGFPLVTGGSVRYRIYSAWDLTALDIGKVMAFAISTFWLGFLTLGAYSFLTEPLPLPEHLDLPFDNVRPLGIGGAVLVGAYLVLSGVRRTPVRVRGVDMQLPPPRIALAQIGLAALDLLFAAGVLYALLPVQATLSYPAFLGIYLLANVVGILSQVPGGLGVFESIMLLFLSGSAENTAILASLLAFRAIYYFLPLAVAGLLLGGYEVYQSRRLLRRLGRLLGPWAPMVAPQILAVTTFAGGAVLVILGATPAAANRLDVLRAAMPLAAVEIAHVLQIVAGLLLLFLARPLEERIRGAYYAAGALLTLGVGASLFKGLDYEEALIVGVALALILPFRSLFSRSSSMFRPGLTTGWAAAVAAVLAAGVWVGLFTHRAEDYEHALWFQFAHDARASRLLRSSLAVPVVLAVLFIVRQLRPRPPDPVAPRGEALERARAIVAASPVASAGRILLGDKTLLFSESGEGLLAYGVHRRSWVAVGDPLGPERDVVDLVWRFRELCEKRGGWPVFYDVREDYLPLYVDIGLARLEYGEEALVPLENISLDRGTLREFRYATRKLEREGLSFQMLPPEEVSERLPELRAVSDRWKSGRNAPDVALSGGRFVEDYVRRLPVAVARRDGHIVAFAVVWIAAERTEVAADFVRHHPDAPEGILDYLFVQLMLWGGAEGYEHFSFGTTPLTGAAAAALAPLWSRIAALPFRHREHFHDLRDLRAYVSRFQPQWQPRFIATPGGLVTSRVLRSIAALATRPPRLNAEAKHSPRKRRRLSEDD